MENGYEYGNWVLFGLAIYMAAMLGIGWYASKRVKNNSDYIVAGRRLGVFFCTGTLFATWFGAGTCMGGAGNAYLFGNQGVIFDPWSAVPCLIITGMIFGRLMRRSKFLTVVDMMEARYGKGVGIATMISLAVAEIGFVGAQLVGFGAILHYFSGIPLTMGILISTVILVIYTYLGGMWAVTLTDVFQMIILMVGMVAMLYVAVPLAGGWSAIFNNDPAGNWCAINQWSFVPTPESAANPDGIAGFFGYTGHMGWLYWAAAWLTIGIGCIPAQDYMQRLLAAKDEKTASISCYLSALLYITVGMMPVIIGMIYFKINPNLSIDDAMSKILLLMAVEQLPVVWAVIFVSALVAALMSSADSAILAAASLIGYNGVKYFKPDTTDEASLKYTRLCVPIVTAFSLALALYFQVIYNLMVVAWTILLVGIFVPFACAFFWKKANTYGALAAFFGGVISWGIFYLIYLPYTKAMETGILEEGVVYFEWAMWDALYIASMWALLTSLVCMVVVSLATQKVNTPIPMCDVDGNRLTVVDWVGINFRRKHPEPVPVVERGSIK